ncbi:MAG TPA: four helix bundle protein [Gemmatimonadaceae bacterium]|nr:four helix bundle protein [Gemmatimonadaceae bacterium]
MDENESYNDDGLEEEGALAKNQSYRLAVHLGRNVVADATRIRANPLFVKVAPQLVASVGSISARIAEGYPRRSRADRVRYYEYAIGSTLESRRWHGVARSALSRDVVLDRMATLASIHRLLLATIRNDRNGKAW